MDGVGEDLRSAVDLQRMMMMMMMMMMLMMMMTLVHTHNYTFNKILSLRWLQLKPYLSSLHHASYFYYFSPLSICEIDLFIIIHFHVSNMETDETSRKLTQNSTKSHGEGHVRNNTKR